MSTTSLSARQRFGGTKVRTGCATCKVRRVKCDEGRPECQRCLKAHRSCGGYPNTEARELQKPLNFVHYIVDFKTGLEALPDTDWRERRSLNVFRERIAGELAGSFCAELWSRFMLLVAVHESAVRHGIIALSTLYEQSFGTLHEPHAGVSEFALQQYSKAIKQVLKLNVSNSGQAVDVALLVCIVFASLEGLQGHYKSAVTHITSGLNLLAEHDSGPVSTPGIYVPRMLFRQLFVRMETQILETGNIVVERCPPQLNKCMRRVPTAFHSLTQATMSMSSYFNKLLLFLQDPRVSVLEPSDPDDRREAIKRRRDEFVTNYEGWCRAFNSISFTSEDKESDITMLDLYRCFVGIILRVDLGSGEVTFDDFDRDFQDLVLLASVFISHVSTIMPGRKETAEQPLSSVQTTLGEYQHAATDLDPQMQGFLGLQPAATPVCEATRWPALPPPLTKRPDRAILPKPGTKYRPTYSMSLGIIAPLFTTCVRCRNSSIRLQALYLLRMCNRKEGMWDSLITAKVAERMMNIESSGAAQLTGTCKAADVPEHARVRELQANFLEPRYGVIRYQRSKLCRCRSCKGLPEASPREQFEEILKW